ncbi:MAG: hypothetical protein ABI091_03690 [Ferruginibacter sp.]
MKKNTILSALMAFAIIACTIFISDGLTYLISSLMALTILAIIHLNRQRAIKLTRWAKANPRKTQVLITVLQIALMALGIFAGYNLKELGYQFSNVTAYVFGAIIGIGFLSIPFLPKRNTIAIPRVVNRHRLAYIGIALSSFVLMAMFGNSMKSSYPNSPLTHAVIAIDNAIFQDNNTTASFYDEVSEPAYHRSDRQALADGSPNIAVYAVFTITGKETITPFSLSEKEIRKEMKMEKKVKRFERQKRKMMNVIKKRLAAAGVTGAAAVILIVLLVITSCVGVCLMLLGATAGSIILGALIAGGSIFGIVKIAEGGKRKPKTKP